MALGGLVPIARNAIKVVLARLGLRGFLRSAPARAIRKHLFQTRTHHLAEIADTLTRADVGWWLAGGWGLDSLLGKQTRIHEDVDICVDASDDGEAVAIEALESLGFSVVQQRARGGSAMPVRVVLRNARGRAIDVLLVQRPGTEVPPDPETLWPVPLLDDADITHGSIDDQTYPALSVDAQVKARSAFAPGRREHRDMAALRPVYGSAIPSTLGVQQSRTAQLLTAARRVTGRFRTASSLLIVVPEAADLVSDPKMSSSVLPPHITILYPFKKPRSIGAADRETLRGIGHSLGGPLEVKLDRIGHFGSDAYLSTSEPQSLLDLMAQVHSQWPNHLPYGGQFEKVIPHLSLGLKDLSPAELERLKSKLPRTTVVTELTLMLRGRWGRWRADSVFTLGPVDGAPE